MNRTVIRNTITVTAVTVALVFAALAYAQNDREVLSVAAPFDRISMSWTTSAGQTVAEACPMSLAMAPYAEPYDWPEARATVRLDQAASSTHVTIHLTGVRPFTRFSAWVLPGVDASSAAGSSEFPLSPRHLSANRGDDGPVGLDNDVWSDARGDATFQTRVALPLVEAGSAADVQALATLLIASHCADVAGHTPEFGPRQLWFQWPAATETSRAE